MIVPRVGTTTAARPSITLIVTVKSTETIFKHFLSASIIAQEGTQHNKEVLTHAKH